MRFLVSHRRVPRMSRRAKFVNSLRTAYRNRMCKSARKASTEWYQFVGTEPASWNQPPTWQCHNLTWLLWHQCSCATDIELSRPLLVSNKWYCLTVNIQSIRLAWITTQSNGQSHDVFVQSSFEEQQSGILMHNNAGFSRYTISMTAVQAQPGIDPYYLLLRLDIRLTNLPRRTKSTFYMRQPYAGSLLMGAGHQKFAYSLTFSIYTCIRA